MPRGWRVQCFYFVPYRSRYYDGCYYVLVKAKLVFPSSSSIIVPVGLFWKAQRGRRVVIEGKVYDHEVFKRYEKQLKGQLASYLNNTKPFPLQPEPPERDEGLLRWC